MEFNFLLLKQPKAGDGYVMSVVIMYIKAVSYTHLTLPTNREV